MSSILSKFFDETTMSIHLKEGVGILAKKGIPGNWQLMEVRKKAATVAEMKTLIKGLLEETRNHPNSFVEIDNRFSKVLQLDNYRVVIVEPPLSNKYEITASRPLKKLSLEDYHISPQLHERLQKQCEGVLIAGRPGEGKSTFAQAMIELYAAQNRIIKTIEAPRDLQVPKNVTQYSLFHSSLTEIHDILLLSRPDYTFFDEVRNRTDFELFKDLRLAGIGMVGVVHGAKPIDAIQRFVGKIELGMIPEIIDTLIFIEKGKIKKVYELALRVKVPQGMVDSDLARPVVVVSDFNNGSPEYEMYSFGSEIVVLPLMNKEPSKAQQYLPFEKTERDSTSEVFPKVLRNKRGFQLVFNETMHVATIEFENGQHFAVYPNRNGHVKISKKGKLAEFLHRKQFRVYRGNA